jgi:hypothetical protein
VRDRRHGGRHRGDAVPGGDPAGRQRSAARRRGLHPPDADALHPDRRRTEDQADAAFGEGTALHRHRARHPAGARRPADPEGGAAQALAVLQCARKRGDPGARRRPHLRRADGLSQGRAGLGSAGRVRHRPGAEAAHGALAGGFEPHPQSGRRGDHRRRRQVHGPQGRLQIADGGARPWRAWPTR